jgi:hypothetical protein
MADGGFARRDQEGKSAPAASEAVLTKYDNDEFSPPFCYLQAFLVERFPGDGEKSAITAVCSTRE